MPTAVITESSENTMSMIAICDDHAAKLARARAVPLVAASPSSALWISCTLLHEQEQAAADQDQVAARDARAADREQRLGQAA